MFEKEIWKEIKNAPGYIVSQYGRIYNNNKARMELQHNDRAGYKLVHLRDKHGNRFRAKVHRIVGEAFVPNPNKKPEINHLDGNKSSNFYKNLEWVSHKENIDHAMMTGLMKRHGTDNPNSSYTKSEVLAIKNFYRYSGLKICDIARYFDFNYHAVYKIINDIRYAKTQL